MLRITGLPRDANPLERLIALCELAWSLRGRLHDRVATQVMRPDCDVDGWDVHSAYTSNAHAALFAPVAAWRSYGKSWSPSGDPHSATVRACGVPLLKKRSEAKRRVHKLMAPTLGFGLPHSGIIAPGEEKGFTPTDDGEGSCKVTFGPSSVLAEVGEANRVGVMAVTPGAAGGWGNHLVCWDDNFLPTSRASQTPTTVLLGMSGMDYLKTIAQLLMKAVINAIISLLVSLALKGLDRLFPGLRHRVTGLVRRFIIRYLRPLLHSRPGRWAIRKAVEAVGGKVHDGAVGAISDWLTDQFIEENNLNDDETFDRVWDGALERLPAL